MFLDEILFLLNEARPDVFGAGSVFQTTHATIPNGDGPFLGIKETGGTAPDGTQNLVKGLPWQGVVPPAMQHPAAQLVFTATTYAAARQMADLAYYILLQVTNRFVGNSRTFYRSIKPLQEPNDVLGADGLRRARVSFNVIADKNPSLPDLACVSIRPFPSTPVVGANPQTIGFVVRYNMWMVVGGSPTIIARSDLPGVLPDQTFTYDAANSELEGLGFGDIAFTRTADYVVPSGVDLSVDDASTLTGWDEITDAAGRSLPSPELGSQSSSIRVTP